MPYDPTRKLTPGKYAALLADLTLGGALALDGRALAALRVIALLDGVLPLEHASQAEVDTVFECTISRAAAVP